MDTISDPLDEMSLDALLTSAGASGNSSADAIFDETLLSGEATASDSLEVAATNPLANVNAYLPDSIALPSGHAWADTKRSATFTAGTLGTESFTTDVMNGGVSLEDIDAYLEGLPGN